MENYGTIKIQRLPGASEVLSSFGNLGHTSYLAVLSTSLPAGTAKSFKGSRNMMLAASLPQIQAFKIGVAMGKKQDSSHVIPAAAYRYWAISSSIGKFSGLWMANSLDEQANGSQRVRSLALSCLAFKSFYMNV